MMGERRLDSLYKSVGQRIHELRKQRGLTQGTLAKECDLKRPSIVLIEKGTQRIPLDGLYKIAKALGCEVINLLPELEDVFPPEHRDGKYKYDEVSEARLTGENEIKSLETVLNSLEKKDEEGDI